MSGLKIFLLGSPRIERDGEAIRLDRKKALALLAYLAVCRQRQERASLAAVFWPEQDRAKSLGSLRRALRSLTQSLGGRYFSSNRSSIALRQHPEIWIDAREFDRLAGRRPAASETGPEAWLAVLPDLERAVELYRGDFLSGFTLRDSESFDEWQFLQTETFRNQLGATLRRLVDGWEQLGDYDRAAGWARRWLSVDLLAEDVHRRLMELYSAGGKRSEAVRQYEKCSEVLREQLQVAPEAETRRLFERIREGAAPGDAAPPEPATATPGPGSNLPDPPTPLVGRSQELRKVADLLGRPDCRLLTLVGPGGIGKTRLALEAARLHVDHFEHGVCFVSLASSPSSRVVGAVTEALGIAIDPQGDAEMQLLAFLADRKLLLVFDNFEHILDRSPLVSSVLGKSKWVKVIVTSRSRLNLQGEWLLEVGGLQFPEAAQTAQFDNFPAVQLFLQAARRVDASFAFGEEDRPAVALICRMVEGMPLGIELAAAWLRLFSCRDIAREIQGNLDFLSSEIRDLPERHRSLRAVFNSSASLLGEEERQVLSALAWFKGGFSLKAASQVARATTPQLLSLIDKSLIARASDRRCHMHELVRQFALELLEREPEKLHAIKSRHAIHYLEFLAARLEGLNGDGQRAAMEEIYPEIDNVRAAWKWASEHRMESVLDKALEAIVRFYMLASWVAEGEETLESAALAVGKETSPLLWARIASRQARLCVLLWRYQKAKALLIESLEIFRAEDNSREIAFALSSMSIVAFHLGDFGEARQLATESLDRCRRIGDPQATADALIQLGRLAGVAGHGREAGKWLTESYELFKSLGDQHGVGRCITNLGVVAFMSGNDREAIRLYEEGLEIFGQLSDRRQMAFCLSNLGVCYESLGEHLKAKQMSKMALDLFQEIGYQTGHPRARKAPAGALENLGRASFALGEYDDSKYYFVEALKTAREVQAAPQALLALLGLARLYSRFGHPDKAWELLTFVSQHPAIIDEVRILAGSLTSELQPRLSPEQKAEAEQRALARDLEETVDSTVEFFETAPPSSFPIAQTLER